MPPVEWYYAKDNKQHGPVPSTQLKQLAQSGQLGPDDLVWREGMQEWIPAKKVKGLFEEPAGAEPAKPAQAPVALTPPAGAPPVVVQPQGAIQPSRRGPPTHLFNIVLDMVRVQFTTAFVDTTSKVFILCGHYGLYAAMGIGLMFALVVGVKVDSVMVILLGLLAILMVAVLQYTASRLSAALDRLNETTSVNMSSPAFLDCFAVLCILAGVGLLAGTLVAAIKLASSMSIFISVAIFLGGVAAFVVCEYCAILALNPASLRINIVPESRAGDEAIGLISFFVKLQLRLMPFVFGIGIVLSTIALLYVCLQAVIAEELEVAVWINVGTMTLFAIAGFAALPLATYVGFLFYYLLVDVMHATLVLPGKLDKLAQHKGKQEG